MISCSMYVLKLETGEFHKVEIKKASVKQLPLKKDGWSFNWGAAAKTPDSETFILQLEKDKSIVQGVLQLVVRYGMLSMDLIELHPNNRSTAKKYDFVAGCLIAFGCRESFKLSNEYEGYLTFESKTKLIDLYKKKYGAIQTLGNKMYISPEQGLKLISKYLTAKK